VISPSAVVLFALLLLIIALVCDLLLSRFWKADIGLRLSLLICLLGLGLCGIAASALASNAGQTEPLWISGFIVTAPSITLALIFAAVVKHLQKKKAKQADQFD
jgi:hypothetical protein